MCQFLAHVVCVCVCLCDQQMLVSELKELIEARTGLPGLSQRIIVAGNECNDSDSLSDCGVSAGDSVHLNIRLRGT